MAWRVASGGVLGHRNRNLEGQNLYLGVALDIGAKVVGTYL